jgi:hypothetical protein
VIRVALRQFRTQALVASVGLVAVLVVVVLTRSHLVDLYESTVATCDARGDCRTVIPSFLDTHSTLRVWLGILVVVVPGLIGVFWGAPLVAREIEAGTFRLAWTQSVSRTRWLGTKLGALGLAAMATAGLLGLMVTWWASLLDKVGESRFDHFDQRGVVPIGHALFAFVLGVTFGVIMRRTLPAMAATLVTFVATRLAFVSWVRPNLFTPVRRSTAIDPTAVGFGSRDGGPMTVMPEPPHIPNAWIRAVDVVDGAGRRMTSSALEALCPGIGLPPPGAERGGGEGVREITGDVKQVIDGCITKVSAKYHVVTTYQPSNRYWAFQWLELGIYVAAAALLAGLCIWWIRRRLR